MRGRTFSKRAILLAGLALSALALASYDAVSIKWKPKAGDTAKYKITAKANIAGTEMNFGAILTTKVVEITADGNVTVEEKQSDISVKFGDQDFSNMGPQTMESSSTMKPNGEVIARKSASEMDNPRLEAALEFVFPDKDMEKGGSWTIKRDADSAKGLFARETKYTYVGPDTVGKRTCHKIEIAFRELDAPSNMEVTGTVWVDVEDGSQVKGTYKMKNIEFAPGTPPADGESEVIRID